MISVQQRGYNELNVKLGKIIRGIQDFKKPLQRTAEWIDKDIKTNWSRQGALYNSGGWKPLAASTRRQRARLGFPPNRPILERTGKLKRGTRVSKMRKNELVISNPVEYAIYHQEGTRKMPQRKIFGIRKATRDAVMKIFGNYIAGVIKGGLIR